MEISYNTALISDQDFDRLVGTNLMADLIRNSMSITGLTPELREDIIQGAEDTAKYSCSKFHFRVDRHNTLFLYFEKSTDFHRVCDTFSRYLEAEAGEVNK